MLSLSLSLSSFHLITTHCSTCRTHFLTCIVFSWSPLVQPRLSFADSPRLDASSYSSLCLFDCACCDLCFLCNFCSSFFFCCRPPVEVLCDTWQWRSACVKWVCVSLSFQQPAHSLLNYRWFKTHFSDLYAILLLFQSFATAAAAAAACTKCRRCGLAISQSQRSRFCPPRSARTAAFTAITVSSHSFFCFLREKEKERFVCWKMSAECLFLLTIYTVEAIYCCEAAFVFCLMF